MSTRLQDDESAGGPAQRPLRGALLLTTAMVVVPFMDACAKLLVTGGVPLLQVIFMRVSGQLVITMPIAMWRHGVRRALCPPRPLLLAGRGLLLLGATFGFFSAIQFIPLAEAVAITFIEPFIVQALSYFLLREVVPCGRWLASAVGFCAVLLIIKPGLSGFHPASLLAVLCACFFTLYLLSTRYLASIATVAPLLLVSYQGVPGTLALGAAAPLFWRPLATWRHVGLALAMGPIGGLSHLLLILAFQTAEASYLAPLLYAEIFNQLLLGYLIFGDFPDTLAFVGIALIILAGLYVACSKQVEPSAPARQSAAERRRPGSCSGGADSSDIKPAHQPAANAGVRSTSTLTTAQSLEISDGYHESES